MQWFGEPWPSPNYRAPICEDDSQRIMVPFGDECLYCQEVIELTDRGIVMPYVDADMRVHRCPCHAECFLRQTLGGPAHLLGECSCNGGGCDPDMGMSPREAALLVWKMHYAK